MPEGGGPAGAARRPGPWREWLAAFGASTRPTLLAEIHATVDLERSLVDLGRPASDVATAAADPLLGARVVIVERAGDVPLAVAEPSTEGRLAATLARHGEGAAGWYVRTPLELGDRLARSRRDRSRPADGPFGRQVLLLGGRPDGPHLILVDPAAVPSRP